MGKKQEVYRDEEDKGQSCISVKWVLNQKVKKLVKTSSKQDFPTEVGIYTIFTLIVSNQWEIKSIDVKTAFLQIKQIERTIYLHSPMEANKSNI